MKKLFKFIPVVLILLALFIVFSCGGDNPVGIPEHEHEIASPLTQILNMTQPDFIFNVITSANNDSVTSFQTLQEFKYAGPTNASISIVRAVDLFYLNEGTSTDIGTATGTIVGSDLIQESLLIPDRLYFFLVTWSIENGNEPFLIVDPVNGGFANYTNFFVLTDEPGDSLNKRTGNSNKVGKLIIK